mmetsp:Transcript_23607/g.58530  ORF Transcript_23607/g.58530 Transcript_23607/m.58530 type:complete len:355 (+) Transcript_23607:198-1262(+)
MLHLKREPGPDAPQNVLRPALLALVSVGDVPLVGPGDKEHRASARFRGNVVDKQCALCHQHPGRPRPPGKFVGRDEDGVLVYEWVQRAVRQKAHGVHVHVQVRRGGGVIPEGERTSAVQLLGDAVHVGHHARHVGCRREGANDERVRGIRAQGLAQRTAVHTAVRALGEVHHLSRRLAPGQNIGVVLVRSQEDHGPRRGRQSGGQRDVHAEDERQLVDGTGGASPREHHHICMLVCVPHTSVARLRYELACLLAEAGGLQAAHAGGGVRVGVHGQDLGAKVVLDRGQRTSRSGPVGVQHRLTAKGAVKLAPMADHLAAKRRQHDGRGGGGGGLGGRGRERVEGGAAGDVAACSG